MSVRTLPRLTFAVENTPRSARATDFGLGILFGCGFTAALFAGIALSERLKAHSAPSAIEDLAAVPIPLEPPPPAPTREEVPQAPMPAGLDLPPPRSVSVANDAAVLLPEFVLRPSSAESAMPAANIDLHLPTNMRPRTDMRVIEQHIYQKFEVDKQPAIISETQPHIDRRDMGQDVLHLNLIWVIEMDGSVTNVTVGQSSGNPKIDSLMVETIKQSIFSPAMKGGRRVRMMTSQSIKISWSHGDIFH